MRYSYYKHVYYNNGRRKDTKYVLTFHKCINELVIEAKTTEIIKHVPRTHTNWILTKEIELTTRRVYFKNFEVFKEVLEE